MKFEDYDKELKQVLAEHEEWLNTDGKTGKRITPTIMKPFLAYHDNYIKNNGEEQRQLNLSKKNLAKADFHSCMLREALFYGANLRGANFESANLNIAKLDRADLTGANFENANCYSAHMKKCILYSMLYTNMVIEDAWIDDETLLRWAGYGLKINARQEGQLKQYKQKKYFGEGIKEIQNLNSETRTAIEDNRFNRTLFFIAAFVCFLFTFYLAAHIFMSPATKNKVSILHLLPFSFPVLVLLLVSTGLLRHISKLNDQYVELTKLKYQEEKASGLMKAAQSFTAHSEQSSDTPENFVADTFKDVRQAMLFEQQAPSLPEKTNESLENEISSMKGTIENLEKLIKDMSTTGTNGEG